MNATETARILHLLETNLAERFGAGPGDVAVLPNGPDHVRVVVDGAHGHVDMVFYLAPGRDLTHVAALLGVAV